MGYLPYGKQLLDEDDIEAVVAVLRSDWLTTGPKVGEFEEKLAGISGTKYAVAFNSGTAALHAAYFAAGVGPGDEVVTSAITFAGTANAALYLGAIPVFADVCPDTVNIDPGKISERITDRTRVIAPVDFAGHPADLEDIMRLAASKGIVVVEDACHAIGALYRGKPVGSIADMTCFSFHPVKHITTGEGGAVVTNSSDYYEKMLAFRTHGIVKNSETFQEQQGPWYHEMQFLGYNYRITDIQCALGISQLKKLNGYLKKRNKIVGYYNTNLTDLKNITLPVCLDDVEPAWHLYVIRLIGEKPPRRELYDLLHKAGIGVQVHYMPVYTHPFYKKLGYIKGCCPVAEDYYQRTLTLPLFPGMTLEDAGRVVREIKNAIKVIRGY